MRTELGLALALAMIAGVAGAATGAADNKTVAIQSMTGLFTTKDPDAGDRCFGEPAAWR